jgi:hypothetical protein|eukprot:SAG31_NODE_4097_length_3590_cov_3.464353_6_plen_168_part_00
MKKVIIILCIPFFTSSGYVASGGDRAFSKEIQEKTPVVDQPIVLPVKPIDDLVNALIYVESRGLDSAIGDTHLDQPSVGVLQIRPIMVREVNRICKRIGSHQRFTLKDRFDRNKSVHMFLIWKEFHHKDSDFESIARSWNGGPKGPKSSRTLPYWEKVEKQLNIKNN